MKHPTGRLVPIAVLLIATTGGGLAPGAQSGAGSGLAPGAGGLGATLPAAPAPITPVLPTPSPLQPQTVAPTGTDANGAPVTGVPVIPFVPRHREAPPQPPRDGEH